MAERERSVESLRVESTEVLTAGGPGNSIFSTVANSVKAVIGAGVLTMSWGLYHASMGPGLLITAFMCLLSAHSFLNIGLCAQVTGKRTFGQIWAALLGEKLAWVPDLATFMFCFFARVAYYIVIGDYLPRGLSAVGIDFAPLQNRQIAILCIAICVMPLDFLKDLSFLGYTSIIGTLGSFYTCGIIALEAVVHDDPQPTDWKGLSIGPGLFITVPTMAFAFNGHFSVPSLYHELDRPSPARWMTVTLLSFITCGGLYFIVAGAGYVMLGSQLALPGRANVLTAPFLQSKPEVMAAYLSTMISVSFGLPLHAQASRIALEGILMTKLPSNHRIVQLSPDARRLVLATCIVTSSLTLAMVVSDLGLINSINGAVSACLIMFILPSMMYLKCGDSPINKLMCRVSIFVGVAAGVMGTITSLMLAAGVGFSEAELMTW